MDQLLDMLVIGKDNAKISKPIYNLVKLLTIKFITYIWYKKTKFNNGNFYYTL